MAKSEDQMAAGPEAIGDSEGLDSRPLPGPEIAVLESRRIFLDRAIAWHRHSRCASSGGGSAQEGANLLALQDRQKCAREGLSLAMDDARSILLRL